MGVADQALTAEQCEYFDVNGSVQICHELPSGKFKILRVNEQACVNAFSSFPNDYVTSTDPNSPLYDPTCQGNGCLPENAPCDATLPCCDGSMCSSGTCVALPPAILSFDVATEDGQVDFATYGLDNAVGPDGTNDGVFDLVVRGEVKAVAVLFANADNTCWQTGQWDTIIDSTSLTPSMTCGGYQVGSNTYGLGVSDTNGATILNGATGELPLLSNGTHSLKLYVPGTQFGKYYQTRVQFADNSVLISEVVAKPETCYADQTHCGITCAYLSDDWANCGACGHSCSWDEYCSAGECQSYYY